MLPSCARQASAGREVYKLEQALQQAHGRAGRIASVAYRLSLHVNRSSDRQRREQRSREAKQKEKNNKERLSEIENWGLVWGVGIVVSLIRSESIICIAISRASNIAVVFFVKIREPILRVMLNNDIRNFFSVST